MAPFYLGAGDHRVFVVDFLMEYIIGSRFVPMYHSLIRRSISYQLQSVKNYLEYLEFLFKHYWIKEKLDSIEKSWELNDKAEREGRLNKLDKECADLLLYSEKKCRKLRTRAVEYSPTLSKLGLHWRLWRKVAHFKQGRFFDIDYIQKIASYLQISEHIDLPLS